MLAWDPDRAPSISVHRTSRGNVTEARSSRPMSEARLLLATLPRSTLRDVRTSLAFAELPDNLADGRDGRDGLMMRVALLPRVEAGRGIRLPPGGGWLFPRACAVGSTTRTP